ncbi:MAG TPA: hypothetical protein VH142_17965 [Polyangiaceae bacterium]|jgi:hypothetical protein|nr:hypothetical protein [Polyangiaceae bacterium]
MFRRPTIRISSLVSIVTLAAESAFAQGAPPPPPTSPPPPPPNATTLPPPPSQASPPVVTQTGPGHARFHPPPSPPEAGAFGVEYVPRDPSVTLLMMNGLAPVERFHRGWYGWYYGRGYAPSYAPICSGPCAVRFAPGEYDFALEKDGKVVPARAPVYLSSPTRIDATYVDRSGLRVAGAIIGIGGIIAGTIMIFASADRNTVCDPGGCYDQTDVDGPLLAGGILVVVASAITGSVLAWQHDRIHLELTPLRTASLEAVPGYRLAAQPPLEGAALTMKF